MELQEFEKHFESIVDKIDTEEWKSEWECDPIEMVNKSKVCSAIQILYNHNKPLTKEVLIRAIGEDAFNILTTLHILSPYEDGTYYIRSRYPDSYFGNLGDNLLPMTVMGISIDDFIWLLSKTNYTTRDGKTVNIFISYEMN